MNLDWLAVVLIALIVIYYMRHRQYMSQKRRYVIPVYNSTGRFLFRATLIGGDLYIGSENITKVTKARHFSIEYHPNSLRAGQYFPLEPKSATLIQSN